MRVQGAILWGCAAGALLVAGCDRGASSPARSHEAADSGGRSDSGGGSSVSTASSSSSDADRGSDSSRSDRYAGSRRGGDDRDEGVQRAREPVPLFKGEPMWADNRMHTAEENAKYHCDKSGPDIGAGSLDACLTKVHAFIDHPPSDVETLTRSNGDKLLYDPKDNLFAVARKDGAPRTFFKPHDGADYWKQQQDEAKSGGGYHRRYGGGDSGEG